MSRTDRLVTARQGRQLRRGMSRGGMDRRGSWGGASSGTVCRGSCGPSFRGG